MLAGTTCFDATRGPKGPVLYRLLMCDDFLYDAVEMSRTEALGEFEQLVLLAVVRLDAEAYGSTIRREIEQRTGRTIAIGALYTALDRLERKGYVNSRLSDPTPQRGGRAEALFPPAASRHRRPGAIARRADAHVGRDRTRCAAGPGMIDPPRIAVWLFERSLSCARA